MIGVLLLSLSLLGSVQVGFQELDEARALVRQGQLGQAQRLLLELGDLDDPDAESSRALLLGNIDYERGQYVSARDHYQESLNLLQSVVAGESDPRVGAARSNRDMATEQINRQVELESAANRLRLAVGAAMLFGALVVAILYRSTRPRALAKSDATSV